MPLELLQKVIKYPLEQICSMWNQGTSCNADNVSNIPMGELNSKNEGNF